MPIKEHKRQYDLVILGASGTMLRLEFFHLAITCLLLPAAHKYYLY